MTAIFHYSMQLSMIVFAPHIGAELDWLQLHVEYNIDCPILSYNLSIVVPVLSIAIDDDGIIIARSDHLATLSRSNSAKLMIFKKGPVPF